MTVANEGRMVVDAFGVLVGLEWASDVPAELPALLRTAWIDAVLPGGKPEVTVTVPSGETDALMQWVTSQVTLRAIEQRRGELLLLHAGGVADENGHVLGFVGASGHGKTTLSRHLGSRYGYVSDETIALDDHLRVLPYRKPLSIAQLAGVKRQVSPTELGLQALPETQLELTKLVVIDRRDEPTTPRLEPLTLAETLQHVLPQLSYARDTMSPLQRVASVATELGGLLRLVYSDATELVAMAAEIFTTAGAVEPWRPVLSRWDQDAGRGRMRIGDAIDAIELDAAVAVCTAAGLVHVLGGVGPEIWHSARRGRSFDDTVQAVVGRYGAPPNGSPEGLVTAGIQQLVEAGVVLFD